MPLIDSSVRSHICGNGFKDNKQHAQWKYSDATKPFRCSPYLSLHHHKWSGEWLNQKLNKRRTSQGKIIRHSCRDTSAAEVWQCAVSEIGDISATAVWQCAVSEIGDISATAVWQCAVSEIGDTKKLKPPTRIPATSLRDLKAKMKCNRKQAVVMVCQVTVINP
jgi:hypothetical protein